MRAPLFFCADSSPGLLPSRVGLIALEGQGVVEFGPDLVVGGGNRGNLSPVDMEKAKAMIEAGQTLEGTFERAGGEGRTRDVAAPDADWFDQGSR